MITDPEILDFIRRTEAAYPAETNDASATDNRRAYDAMCEVFRASRPSGLPVADLRLGGVPCRIYGNHSPVQVLYFHGGGFVVGGLDSHDDVCAEISGRSGLRVISAAYRLAPEHRWPAQLEDALAVWQTLDRPTIVAGDSAGATLAAGLCLALQGSAQPLAQVLIYPWLGGDRSLPSYRDNAEAPMLRTADLDSYQAAIHGDTDPNDPRAAPLQAADLSDVAPAWIVTADVDPLRDDGPAYAARLRAAGVPATCRNEPQLPHGYLRARHSSARARASFDAIVAAVTGFAERGG
ncbi:alpha/beta hydrolase [Palleronia caenipelagi]|uniref:Alpha/beta hydrolase n=1 Tax=Palleronia caenipelagi TaxID=2489174 RepID=A0A547QA35_9RHOB|nr:alpha/beta hydrolase [Palleronia caenipelagi]TRD23258.1 alpha/beta hydrolase [Palleronia caenipelagi]